MISVVIPNWNGIKLIGMCLDSFQNSTFKDYEIIIVDNGSTDGSKELVKKKYPTVKLVELPENLGFARACNEGIKESKGDYICLLNNDIEIHPAWLLELYKGMERHPECGMGASKMLFMDQKDIIYNTGDLYHIWGVGGGRGQGEKDSGQYDQEEYVFGACAGAGIYRKDMFKDIGTFDEDFFIFAEDVDLNFRANWAGYKTIYLPKAVVYHIGTATVGLYSDRYIYLCNKNDINVIVKNMTLVMYFKNIFKILKHQINSTRYFIQRGKGHIIFKSKIGALLQFFKMIPRRYSIQKNIKCTDKEIQSNIISN